MASKTGSRRFFFSALTLAVVLAGAGYTTGIPVASEARAQPSSCYRTFWPNGRAVEMEACEYEGGGSGYTILRNNTNRDMSVCWTLHFNNGRSSRACKLVVRSREESKGSCYLCSHKNSGGLVNITWRKVEPVR